MTERLYWKLEEGKCETCEFYQTWKENHGMTGLGLALEPMADCNFDGSEDDGEKIDTRIEKEGLPIEKDCIGWKPALVNGNCKGCGKKLEDVKNVDLYEG